MLKILTILMFIFLTGCGDSFRYPCQDPQNWKKPECEPPACEASGTCTKDLVTKEMYEKLKKNP
jgi:hypothetical protein